MAESAQEDRNSDKARSPKKPPFSLDTFLEKILDTDANERCCALNCLNHVTKEEAEAQAMFLNIFTRFHLLRSSKLASCTLSFFPFRMCAVLSMMRKKHPTDALSLLHRCAEQPLQPFYLERENVVTHSK